MVWVVPARRGNDRVRAVPQVAQLVWVLGFRVHARKDTRRARKDVRGVRKGARSVRKDARGVRV
jgi:hypothetical protein